MAVLNAAERRAAIGEELARGLRPISATALAKAFGVSRQIIVGDVALLRAAGADISATPRGYVWSSYRGGYVGTVACIHTPEQMGSELRAIVDAGGEVMDVIVEHPVYGQLTGMLRLRSRYDVEEFLRRVAEEEAKPLSDLTGGIHLHTICAADEAVFLRVRDAIDAAGFLLHM